MSIIHPPIVLRTAALTLTFGFLLAGCDQVRLHPEWPVADLSPMTRQDPAPPAADPRRINGLIVPTAGGVTPGVPLVRQNASAPPIISGLEPAPAAVGESSGGYTFDYVDTDIRELVRVVLGNILQVNYAIDPNVQGTATIKVTQPIRRDAMLPVLAGVLAQNGVSLTNENGIYRVSQGPVAGVPAMQGARSAAAGAQIVPLRYASAARLAAMLEPYAGDTAKVTADPAQNALLVSGPAAARENLIELVRVFDVDFLAGQSYAMFAVRKGDPGKVAAELKQLLQTDSGGALGGAVNVIPVERANSVLVIAAQQSYIDRAGRFVAQLDQAERLAGRQLHVYYVQNGQATDLQPILQRAFGTPGPAGANAPGSVAPNAEVAQVSAVVAGAPGTAAPPPLPGAVRPAAGEAEDAAAGSGGGEGASLGSGVRILADRKRNALLISATEAEYANIEATIRKLDLLPLQVLIEATVAEVTLNDSLRYGTQYFLNKNGFSVGQTNAASNPTTLGSSSVIDAATAFGGLLAPEFPAFYFARTVGSIQFAIQALQSVTDVKVVSSPKLLILDNERARLQVGDLVPVITQSATAVSSPGAPVVNNVDYRETGVILAVTPRINAGGLVTLDIEQEVSDVVNTTSSTINSPTFQQRKIRSRVVVQDGDTIGLGGLIRDSKTVGNSGLPVLRSLPLVGPLFSTQDNSAVRTELIVLITPRVVRDQRDALALTEELRRKLAPAAQLVVPPPPPPMLVPAAATVPMPPPPRPRPAR